MSILLNGLFLKDNEEQNKPKDVILTDYYNASFIVKDSDLYMMPVFYHLITCKSLFHCQCGLYTFNSHPRLNVNYLYH